MLRTIKGRLTVNVIGIVVAAILLTTAGIVWVAGKRMIQDQSRALQLNADKYAEEINAWVENEKMLAEGAAGSIRAGGRTDTDFLQSVVDAHAQDREELLNLYCGTKDSRFIQSNKEAEVPEGYDPVARGWYQQAAEKGGAIVTDPYMDAVTGQMCTTIAVPVYIDDELAGVVGLDVTLATVTELTGSINYEEGVYGFLVDSSGQYVAHKNKKFEPTGDTAVAAEDVVPGMKGMLEGTDSGVERMPDYDGSACYFAVSGIKGSLWKLGVVVPAANLMGSLAAMVGVAAAAALVIIVFVALFMAWLIGRMLEPVQMLKQFASGDFSEHAVSAKGVPKEYRNETEQIRIATAEVKQQMREIILNTKQEAEKIGGIAEGASAGMAVLDKEIDGIFELAAHVSEQTTRARMLTENIKENGQELGDAIENVARKAEEAAEQSNGIMERAGKQYEASGQRGCRTLQRSRQRTGEGNFGQPEGT